MAFMTPDEFKRKQEEVKQMDLAKKWIDTFQKMDMSRQQSGFGSMNIRNQSSDPMDKMMQMMEKKQEMEMTASMMKDIFSSDKPDKKKQNTIMESLSNLIATNPDQAQEFLQNLDENTISKISLLSNPDPNAQVLRSMLTKNKSGGDMNNMLDVFTKLLALQKDQSPKVDPNQSIMMMMMKSMLDNNNKPIDNSQNTVMIEMMRQQAETARDQARISEDRAREENSKFNQLMITVMNDKVQESRNAPGLIDQINHLGESVGVLKNLGLGGESRSLEELKLSHEQEKWRLDQQMARGQQDMWKSIAEQGLDRLADVMSAPAMQEFASAAGGKVSNSIANMQQPQQSQQPQNPQVVPTRSNPQILDPDVREPLNPTELVTIGDINDQEIPISVPTSYVFGEAEKSK